MTPSFIEDHISQIPALQMLMKLGYRYLYLMKPWKQEVIGSLMYYWKIINR